jgi:SAM-dependent methyltransferase
MSLTHSLDRPSRRHGLSRKLLRRSIHFLAYRFVLSCRKRRTTRAAGFYLEVPPTVFHPRAFISSECFASFIDRLDLRGKCVADVGTGSGVLALAAARAGAASVVATDINPIAAIAATRNAKLNELDKQVKALCCDLLSALPPAPLFDVIFSSPPKHAGEPIDLADASWHAGESYRRIAPLFEQCRDRLKNGGRAYVMLSSDSDLGFFGRQISQAGFLARHALERSILIESFIIYELVVEQSPPRST